MQTIFDSKEGKIAFHILQTLKDAGYQAYLVGGCVRNYLLGLPIVDFDITTSAQPQAVVSLFPKTIQTGVRYGTVTVVQDGIFVEVTTFRSEKNYEDTRHPSQIIFETSVTADLERRDFTMNAIACSVDGKLIDPFFGQADIKQRVIRCVGDPLNRMQEDLLRCVRAFRFAAQLGFEIEPATLSAIRKSSPYIGQVARERVGTEWRKMLAGSYLIPVEEMAQAGWLPVIDPSYTANDLPQWQKFSTFYKELPEEEVQLVSLAILLGKTESALAEWLQSLRYGRDMVRTCKQLYQVVHTLLTKMPQKYTSGDQTFTFIRELLLGFGLHPVEHALALVNRLFPDCFIDVQRVMEQFHQMPIKHPSELMVTGHDLMELANRPGGPWVGQVLQEMTELVLHGRLLNDRRLLLEWAQNHLALRNEGE